MPIFWSPPVGGAAGGAPGGTPGGTPGGAAGGTIAVFASRLGSSANILCAATGDIAFTLS